MYHKTRNTLIGIFALLSGIYTSCAAKTGTTLKIPAAGKTGISLKTSATAKTDTAGKTIYIRLKLNSLSKFKVSTAPLKYNKHAAFSFTLDDGYRSAYLCAFKLLNGGQISPAAPDEYHSDQGGDGTYSKGLFYSDGCGHQVPFKLAVALNAGLLADHPENRGRLSWAEVKEMYDHGWNFLNHGYYHRTKHGTDFNAEVVQNIQSVKEHIGLTMSQFVVPGGESDPGYEHEYEKDAFNNGSFSVASYKGAGPVIHTDKPLNLKDMVYARDFMQSAGEKLNLSLADQHVKVIDSLMKLPQTVWYNGFTHSVGNGNLWNLSMLFPEFKHYMITIAEKYGTSGTDQLWMAPWQEVYEYIWLRDHTRVSFKQHGRDIVIRLDVPEIPSSFKYAAVSLNVKTESGFKVNPAGSLVKITDNGLKAHNLLNVTLNNQL